MKSLFIAKPCFILFFFIGTLSNYLHAEACIGPIDPIHPTPPPYDNPFNAEPMRIYEVSQVTSESMRVWYQLSDQYDLNFHQTIPNLPLQSALMINYNSQYGGKNEYVDETLLKTYTGPTGFVSRTGYYDMENLAFDAKYTIKMVGLRIGNPQSIVETSDPVIDYTFPIAGDLEIRYAYIIDYSSSCNCEIVREVLFNNRRGSYIITSVGGKVFDSSTPVDLNISGPIAVNGTNISYQTYSRGLPFYHKFLVTGYHVGVDGVRNGPVTSQIVSGKRGSTDNRARYSVEENLFESEKIENIFYSLEINSKEASLKLEAKEFREAKIYSLNGALIKSFDKKSFDLSNSIKIDGISGGVYILNVDTDQGVKSRKFIVPD